jgi:hypothetical protein
VREEERERGRGMRRKRERAEESEGSMQRRSMENGKRRSRQFS